MALAPYFAKAELSAASLLQGFDAAAFARVLEAHTPAILFDAHAAERFEGKATLELAVDLSARFYPRLLLGSLGDKSAATAALLDQLSALAIRINPLIEIISTSHLADVDAALVVGETRAPASLRATYIGSSEWEFGVSNLAPVGSGESMLPFAAGAAACVGLGTLFRDLFSSQLDATGIESPVCPTDSELVFDFRLSLLSMATPTDTVRDPAPAEFPIGDTTLVGVGAIGSGALWALARTAGLVGQLTLVDPESVEISNVQRYTATTMADVGRAKVDVAAAYLSEVSSSPESPPALTVIRSQRAWGAHASSRETFTFDRVLVALDSAEGRLQVQATLPRWIVNAWTQPENLGVSRHPNFLTEPCLGCLYINSLPRKSKDILVAEAVRATGPSELMEVRTRLHDGLPVGEAFVRRVAQRFAIPEDGLLSYATQSLDDFYVQALCGGVILNLGGGHDIARQIEVPLAFQSALAGILLAAELVIDVGRLRGVQLPCRTEINLLRPIGAHINVPTAKLVNGRCLCQDDTFIAAYRAKYSAS